MSTSPSALAHDGTVRVIDHAHAVVVVGPVCREIDAGADHGDGDAVGFQMRQCEPDPRACLALPLAVRPPVTGYLPFNGIELRHWVGIFSYAQWIHILILCIYTNLLMYL